MNRLKHSVAVTDICRTCGSDAALEFCGFIGNYIAVEVGEYENLEGCSAFGINKLCGCDVDKPVVGFDFRVVFGDFLADVEEFSVGCLDYIGLCDN